MTDEVKKTRRRGHGEGSIFQRKDGRWSAAMTLGGGQRKTFYGKTRRDVSDQLKTALSQQQQGTLLVAEHMTAKQFLAKWLETGVKSSVKDRTYVGYESIVRIRVDPHIGTRRLDKITPLDLQELYGTLERGGLSSRSVVHTHRVLHQAFRQAVRWRYLLRNPCDDVKLPQTTRRELNVLDKTQVTVLLAAVTGDRHALYSLAVKTGMRQGELLGLQWKDIDLTAGRLAVHRSLQRQKGKGLLFVTPKTSRSRRSIHMGPRLVGVLKEHRRTQLEHRLLAGELWQDQDLVFSNATGGPLDPSHQTAVFKNVVTTAKLPPMRFHDLRHTAATLMLGSGTHPKVVSEMLGHSTVTLTLDVYSHYIPVLHDQAATMMDELLAESAVPERFAVKSAVRPGRRVRANAKRRPKRA
jgi:integrase